MNHRAEGGPWSPTWAPLGWVMSARQLTEALGACGTRIDKMLSMPRRWL
jgi:hypothetical protein